jgi:hypothetical protein
VRRNNPVLRECRIGGNVASFPAFTLSSKVS